MMFIAVIVALILVLVVTTGAFGESSQDLAKREIDCISFAPFLAFAGQQRDEYRCGCAQFLPNLAQVWPK